MTALVILLEQSLLLHSIGALSSFGLLRSEVHLSVKIYSDNDFPKYLPKLNALYDDLFTGGKGFRAKLIQRISDHLLLEEKSVQLLAQTIEFIHNASLLHDDLIDRSHLRRSKPTAWLKYSPEYAVLAGDYLLARVMCNLSSHGNLKLIQVTAETISNLLEGEWIQDSLIQDWSVNLPKLDQVHNLKTASLFKWCLRAPFLAKEDYRSDLHELLDDCGSILGLLFQRSDDLIDFNVRNHEGKAVLGDLKSGYLNSFGAFLLEQLPQSRVAAFKNSKTLEDVFDAIGKSFFESRLAEFDKRNQELIGLYNHHLKSIESLLNGAEKKLVDDLRELPSLLYWREK